MTPDYTLAQRPEDRREPGTQQTAGLAIAIVAVHQPAGAGAGA